MLKKGTVHLWKWGAVLVFLNKTLELKLITSAAALPSLFSLFFALTKQQMPYHVAEQPDSDLFLQLYQRWQNAPSTNTII